MTKAPYAIHELRREVSGSEIYRLLSWKEISVDKKKSTDYTDCTTKSGCAWPGWACRISSWRPTEEPKRSLGGGWRVLKIRVWWRTNPWTDRFTNTASRAHPQNVPRHIRKWKTPALQYNENRSSDYDSTFFVAHCLPWTALDDMLSLMNCMLASAVPSLPQSKYLFRKVWAE